MTFIPNDKSSLGDKIIKAHIQITASMLPKLPKMVESWWEDVCNANGIYSEVLDLSDTCLHIIELAKNAIEFGNIGLINLNFTRNCVNITIEDDGPGIDNPLRCIDTSIGGGFGLRCAFSFADLFVIETKGIKYQKINQCLALTGPSNVQLGTKITCVKSLLEEIDVVHSANQNELKDKAHTNSEHSRDSLLFELNTLLGAEEGGKMAIANHIDNVRQGLRQGRFISEASVSQGILLPVLNELGWPVFNTSIVIPEFSIEGRRVDYALCHPENRPSVFIEVKKVGLSDGADRQLFEYAFHLGVPMAILMDGQEWSFYLPGEQGRYDERRVYKLDLLERDISEAVNRLERYLSYSNVCSGAALNAARSDYQNAARIRVIEDNLPKAWIALLKEQDSLLLDLLAEKVEDLCGYKPDLDVCSQFLEKQGQNNHYTVIPKPENHSVKKYTPPLLPSSGITRTRAVDNFTIVFKGKEIPAGSAREVMTKIFQLLAQEDKGFLDRFASRKHGKKRRFIAREKQDLYPGRPDLSEQHSVEIIPGWWLGTNYSRRNIQEIIELALEVSGPQLQNALKANVL